MKTKTLLVLAIAGAVLVTAVVTIMLLSRESDQRRHKELLSRATQYWDAFRINDLYTCYNMEAEVVLGRVMPHQYDTYTMFNASLAGYTFTDVRVNGDTAEITVVKELTMPDMNGKTFYAGKVRDGWTYLNGNWYHGLIKNSP